jgi:hypothetical protein
VFVFLLVLLGIGYAGVELVEEEFDAGYGDDAAENDFLAVELFLLEQGIPAETVTGMALLDDLPPTTDALLLSASRESLSDRRRAGLVDWVNRGGALMVVAHSVYDPEAQASDDRLLDELGVFLLGPDDAGEEVDESQEETEEAEEAEAGSVEPPVELAPPVAEVLPEYLGKKSAPESLADLLGRDSKRAICLTDSDRLTEVVTTDDRAILLELAGEGELAAYEDLLEAAYLSSTAQVLSLPVGKGEVTVVTSIDPFRNRRIHCHDHAFFLWYVMDGREKVWLLHDPDVQSLVELAVSELPLTTLGGLLLAVLFGSCYSLRFGVVPTDDEAPRRELREYLEASVTFNFRKGGFAALLERLREDLVRDEPRDRAHWAERAGVGRDAAEQAIRGGVPSARREVLTRIRTMLRMRRAK